jgi:hypothetical protein
MSEKLKCDIEAFEDILAAILPHTSPSPLDQEL